jgi:septal ring factor EnvC (AmiA/AmiB activator)
VVHTDQVEIKEYIEQQKKQIGELYTQITVLNTKINSLNTQLENEKKEREELPIPRSFIKKTQELMATINRLEEEVEYYKKHVPVQIIINKEQSKKPTRSGGLPK